MPRTLRSTPATAAVIVVMLGVLVAVQFSVPMWQEYGVGSLYLWPVTLAALWFGVRSAMGAVGVVVVVHVIWLAVVPHSVSAGVGTVSILLRAATCVFVALVVGEFAQRLRTAAFTDTLTKLPNRRAFFDEVERRSRTTSTLGIVACDVDGLKQINDDNGHGAGDDAIITIGQALKSLVGSRGFVCRVGGDEFLALTTPELVAEIEALRDPIPGARLGISLHATRGERIDAAIATADHSLYRAKRRPSPTSSALPAAA